MASRWRMIALRNGCTCNDGKNTLFSHFLIGFTLSILSKSGTITHSSMPPILERFHISKIVHPVHLCTCSTFPRMSKSGPVPRFQGCPRVDRFHIVRRAYFWIDSTFPDTHDSILYPYLSYLYHAASLARLACHVASRGLMTTPCPVCVRYKPAIAHW